MTPYYSDPRHGLRIFLGDCREVLPEIMQERQQVMFGVLLTDPPYGHAELWQGGTWGAQEMYAKDARQWDNAKHSDIELRDIRAVCKKQIIWGGNYYRLPESRCWLAWDKQQKINTLADFELAWTNLEMPCKSYSESRNPDGPRQHPTQKPLSLMCWCLSFVDVKWLLDPFLGSGTSLVAAKKHGIKGIGIEREEKYCEMAARRLEACNLFNFGIDKPENAIV
jgi:site-specific DNA-methyltransferase (adenine-specific)